MGVSIDVIPSNIWKWPDWVDAPIKQLHADDSWTLPWLRWVHHDKRVLPINMRQSRGTFHPLSSPEMHRFTHQGASWGATLLVTGFIQWCWSMCYMVFQEMMQSDEADYLSHLLWLNVPSRTWNDVPIDCRICFSGSWSMDGTDVLKVMNCP